MSTALPVARFCTLCSLLCELPTEDANFGAAFCSRRNRELDAVRDWLAHRDTLTSVAAWEPVLEEAKRRLANTQDLLVTGRMRCVDSSRGALAIAQQKHARLDSWESDATFEGISAFQRVGATTISLSEARDITELMIVIGGDEWIEDFPKLPGSLYRGESIPVLLLGSWSDAGRKPWLDAGFEVLSIDTPISQIPRALSEASACDEVGGWDSTASRWLHRAGYTTVVWSMKYLNIEYGDLWYESMMDWIARQNETKRVAAMCWSDLETTFHQVCTWWTGFPGRIQFNGETADYDPSRYSAQRWLEERSVRGPRTIDSSSSNASLILWVDDSFEDLPTAVFESDLATIAISPRQPPPGSNAIWLPCLPAGLGNACEFFRGDHAILLQGIDPYCVDHQLPPAVPWLKGLLEP